MDYPHRKFAVLVLLPQLQSRNLQRPSDLSARWRPGLQGRTEGSRWTKAFGEDGGQVDRAHDTGRGGDGRHPPSGIIPESDLVTLPGRALNIEDAFSSDARHTSSP